MTKRETKTEIAKIENMLSSRSEEDHGNAIAETALAWHEAGFNASSAGAWLDVGVFDPTSAKELRDEGYSPDSVSMTDEEWGGYAASIGYKYANGDISMLTLYDLTGRTEVDDEDNDGYPDGEDDEEDDYEEDSDGYPDGEE